MCGISGSIGIEVTQATAGKVLQTMARRGPDGSGVYRNADTVLLHARLAVIDLQGGSQPMVLPWKGETYAITYNGELYNTQELRYSLESMGHEFLTRSDTEVILHSYAQWGEDCLDRLNGIYAFGIWEEKRKRLFLARDRMGVKPLFYTVQNGALIFASEIKSILAYPDIPARLDSQGAAQLLLLGPGRIPGSGIFKDIMELKPGWKGYFQDGKLQTRAYWRLLDREYVHSFQETVECVRELVLDAIYRQMVSDVPLGTFLSGGLDSSIISAVCNHAFQKEGKTLDTFSVDYLNNDQYFVPGKFQPESDGAYIKLMQKALNSNHHFTVLSPQILIDSLEKATVARDLPGMADVDFSLLAFCGQIRKDVKVALSGECADEIFGGYPWYRDPEVRAVEGFPWAQNTQYRAGFLSNEMKQQFSCEEFVMDHYLQTIRESDILPSASVQERRMKEMVNLNQQWFMQTLLDRKDRMSMYESLEVRVPFCDHRIAEYLYGVPWEYKDYKGKEKGLLRTAMEGLLPEKVLWRKKSPYPKTFHPEYMEAVSDRLRMLLEQDNAPIYQIVNKEALRQLLTAEYAWPWYGQLMKVPQTIAYMLQINYWLERYHVQVI